MTIGAPDDSFVAFTLLSEVEVPRVGQLLPPDSEAAVLLPCLNFDPPEDHPAEPDFTWAPILLNDFSDVDGDVGTEAGLYGDFSRLLQWQPPIDSSKTRLIAIVEPGPFNRTQVAESSSTPILAQMLVEHGYCAVGIRCKSGSDDEFAEAASYAARLSEISGLTILHVARESRRVRGTSFSISVRELWGPADL
jgi:hypothetical protein